MPILKLKTLLFPDAIIREAENSLWTIDKVMRLESLDIIQFRCGLMLYEQTKLSDIT